MGDSRPSNEVFAVHRPPIATAFLLASALTATASAQFLPYGRGCSGSLGPLKLERPVGYALDGGFTVRFGAGPLPPAGLGTLLVGFTKRDPGLDLTALGMPGCALYHSADVTIPLGRSGSSAATLLPIPQSLNCGRFYVQVVGLDPGANPRGVVSSDAATVVLDPVAETVLHVAEPSNLVANYTVIDHPKLNGEPGAVFHVSQFWNPTITLGVYNPHEIGVFFETTSNRWAIFNQDRSPMPAGAGFHVLLPNSRAFQFTATATATNTSGAAGQRLTLDHPGINGKPFAELAVTPVWNPPGSSGIYHDHAIGTRYDSSTARWQVFNQDDAAMPLGSSFHVVVAGPNLANGSASVHEATSGSVSSNVTYLDNAALNDNPHATLTLTQIANPRLRTNEVRNAHPIGVYYDTFRGRWGVFNQDRAPMPIGAAFQYLVGAPQNRSHRTVHTTTTANRISGGTRVDDPELNRRHDKLVFATAVWNPSGPLGVYNVHPTGVLYSNTEERWFVVNQDRGPMQIGAAFNLLVPNSGATTFLATADTGNASGHVLRLAHPGLDGNPDAKVFVEPLYGLPGQTGGRYHDANVAIFYAGGQWRIFSEGFEPILPGTRFAVLVADEWLDHVHPAYTHVTDAANTSTHITYLDHPALNGRPNAQITVTQHWSPPGGAGTYNDSPVGVFYSLLNGGRWAIFNQDQQPMGLGAGFNVLVGAVCR